MDAVDFLSKPCALGELEVALDRARQRRVQRVPSELPIPAPPEPDDLGLSSSSSASSGSERGDAVSLEDIERRHILATLEKNHGNRTQTAAELGISLRKLYYRLGQYHREGLLSK